MSTERYNYSDDFQSQIQACQVRHSEVFSGFGTVIEPRFFNGDAAIQTAFVLHDYFKQYGFYPTFATLADLVFSKFARTQPDKAGEYVDYITKLTETDVRDVEHIQASVVNFARERALYNAIKIILLAKQEGKEVEGGIIKLVEDALSTGADINALGFDLGDDLENVIDRTTKIDYGVKTGFEPFDKLWRNGWPAGWLISILAPPKRFKTCCALNLAMNMASAAVGADVIYFACEIGQDLAARRVLQAMTGQTTDELFTNPEQFKVISRNAWQQNMAGRLWFKSFPSKTTTVMELQATAKNIMRHHNLKPRAVFVDFAETVRPSNTAKNVPDWRQQADIYTEVRAMGSALGCCTVLPDRCNKETVGRKTPSMKSFQGSFEKAGIVDAAIGLCQTDEEYLDKIIRYFIFLNRHGAECKHYTGTVNGEIMRLSVDCEIGYEPEQDEKAERKLRPKTGLAAVDS